MSIYVDFMLKYTSLQCLMAYAMCLCSLGYTYFLLLSKLSCFNFLCFHSHVCAVYFNTCLFAGVASWRPFYDRKSISKLTAWHKHPDNNSKHKDLHLSAKEIQHNKNSTFNESIPKNSFSDIRRKQVSLWVQSSNILIKQEHLVEHFLLETWPKKCRNAS